MFFRLATTLSTEGTSQSGTTFVFVAGALCLAVASLIVDPSSVTAEPTCKTWQPGGERLGELEHEAIDESSGLDRSANAPDLLWTHNDSGGEARLFLVDEHGGAHAGVVHLEGISATDWEGMAVGPCRATEEAPSCVYVADVGDNRSEREHVSIVRFPEPTIPDDRPVELTVSNAERTQFQYPEGPRNAETLLVHPSTAKLYVVAKSGATRNGVYRVPNQPNPDRPPHEAERIATVELPHMIQYGRMATGGDIAPSGRELSLRTYLEVFTFCLPPDAPFASIFETEPTRSSPMLTAQSEALAYGARGDHLWITSEQRPAPLIRLTRDGHSPEAHDDGDSASDLSAKRDEASESPAESTSETRSDSDGCGHVVTALVLLGLFIPSVLVGRRRRSKT